MLNSLSNRDHKGSKKLSNLELRRKFSAFGHSPFDLNKDGKVDKKDLKLLKEQLKKSKKKSAKKKVKK